MVEWVQSVVNADQAGILVLSAVFLLGVVSVFTCVCNFAIIGAITGYTGVLGATGKTKTIAVSALFVFLGAVAAMSAIGYAIGFASEIVSAAMGNYWKIAAGVILLIFGVLILDTAYSVHSTSLLPFEMPKILPDIPSKKSGITGAITFGLVVGGLTVLTNICCNPIFPMVAAAALVKGSALWGFFLLFSYALGYGVTIAVAIVGVGLGISKTLSKFATVIKYAGGVTLIVLGFYFLLTI